jgi:hypothetical protein
MHRDTSADFPKLATVHVPRVERHGFSQVVKAVLPSVESQTESVVVYYIIIISSIKSLHHLSRSAPGSCSTSNVYLLRTNF